MTRDDWNAANERRRRFLAGSLAALGTTTMASCASSRAKSSESMSSSERGTISAGDTILFQGDSITDAGRAREDNAEPNLQANLGNGYAWLAAAGLLVGRPADDLRIQNRGISGNKVFQLDERWDADCLELAPDVLSILIGVNDIWHGRGGDYDGTAATYERDYRALLARTRRALPNTKLVVCEPFVLRCGAVDDSWFPDFDDYRAASRRVAEEHEATFVAFHEMFERAVRYAPPAHWAGDGVHPTPAGAALMAQTWLAAVGA